jgi:hypothetical protein
MAIKSNVTIQHLGQSISFNNAYIKVHQIEMNKPIPISEIQPTPPKASRATVMFYTDETCANQIKVWHYTLDFDFSAQAKNAWEQVYKYLKTLEEFAGATDC